MNVQVVRQPLVGARIGDHMELTKPRITMMILFTVLLGYALGSGGEFGWTLLPTLLGTALITSGTGAWNQYLERDLDGRMRRTERRPLPSGRVRPSDALSLSLALCVSGALVLLLLVNTLTAALALATTAVYVFAYTPLKPRTSLATLIGAVPGALPPMGGWAAATGTIGAEAVALFTVLFLWQVPHFLAIGWLYRQDYARTGMRMLPVDDDDGRATARQAVLASVALLAASLVLPAIGAGGWLTLATALVSGLAYILAGLRFARHRSPLRARQLLLTSVLYVPLLGAALMLDRFGA